MTFKVGDKVRRISGSNDTTPVGFEGVIRSIKQDPDDDLEYRFDNDAWGYHQTCGKVRWELVEPNLTTGPVRTVTRREVVGGVYGALTIRKVAHALAFKDTKVLIEADWMGATELKAAAAVLLELAGALE